jgi:PKD repeat protein
MSEQAQPKRGGWLKAALIGMLGLGGGAAGTYATALVDRVAKPTRPVANFAVAAEGLTVVCQNHASGESGWWDFGDGTALEPFDAGRAEQKHTYAKPGNYTVKLTVRNFVADENERSVPVEVSAAAKDAPAPQILGFAVQPVSPVSVAPATFRVTAEVKNADNCVWDFGDGRLEVAEAGKIDRLVAFESPGQFPVQLVAHNGKQAAKQAAAVKVDAPPAGSLMVVVKVTDTGTRPETATRSESVAVPVPKDKAVSFSKTIVAKPGFSILIGAPAHPEVAGVKNLKVEVAADRKSATLSGEWAGDPKALTKAAGGSDVLIPLKVTETRSGAIRPVVNTISGGTQNIPFPDLTVVPVPPGPPGPPTVGGVRPASYTPPAPQPSAAFELPLPAGLTGMTGWDRRYQLSLTQGGRPLLTEVVPLPWSGVLVATDGRRWSCSITPQAGRIAVSVNPLP